MGQKSIFTFFKTVISQVVAVIGCIFTGVVSAFFYGMSNGTRGGFLDVIIIAVITGLVFAGVLYISRTRDMHIFMIAPFVLSVFTVIGGHIVGYSDAHDFAWNYVHDIAPQKFGPEWQGLGRDENFSMFVGYVTDNPGGGFWDYLRLQSSIGTSESRQTKYGRSEWTVSGLFVWVAWIIHMVIFFVGFMAASGAIGGNLDPPLMPPPLKSEKVK